jgi:carbon monoxide dehydrogenase subunit G
MKLRNEFSIAAPVDSTWQMLLDIQRVAQCLPGAKIEPADGEGVYRGQMKVRLGPMTVDYKGTAKLGDVDEDDRVATIDVKGKEARGQGSASATITNSVQPDGHGTKVTVETDLNITGRPAQFGRGIMEDVASKMLGDFAKRLVGELLSGNGNGAGPAADEGPQTVGASRAAAAPGAGAGDTGAGGAGPSASGPSRARPADDDDEVLDLSSAVTGPLVKRAGIAGAALLVLLVLAAALRPRPKGLTVTLRYR